VDGQQRDLGAYRYLLSPDDVYALYQVPALVRIGVSCFKIEGRYFVPISEVNALRRQMVAQLMALSSSPATPRTTSAYITQ
jgi:collagenase-like PrtC family protease